MEKLTVSKLEVGALQTFASMGWDTLDTKTGKTEYLSLKEGDTVTVRFIDEAPVTRWTHWLTKVKRTITCLGDGCPVCAYRDSLSKAERQNAIASSSRKCAMQVIDRTDKKIKIFDQGVTAYGQLREVAQEYGDLRNFDIKIKRTSDGYVFFPQPPKPMSEEDILLASTKLDLVTHFKPPTADQAERLLYGESPQTVFASNNPETENETENESFSLA